MKQVMVAVLVMLLALTLMTTINVNVAFAVEGDGTTEAPAATETPAAGTEAAGTEDAAAEATSEEDAAAKAKAEEEAKKAADAVKWLDKNTSVSASAAAIVSGSTGEVIFEHHGDRKLGMGASTQLMTAMIVIDNMHDQKEYDNRVEITAEMAQNGTPFAVGESVKVSDLMYAMLMTSSEDAARALAIYTTGSEASFVELMNSKARQMGLDGTQYTNASGAYEPEHFSTVGDTATITRTAFRYKMIKEMVGTAKHEIPASAGSEAKTLINKNPLLEGGDSGSAAYKGLYGGSYELLTEPKDTAVYVGAAVRDDMDMIVVLFQEPAAKTAGEASALLDYGFKHVTRKTLIDSGKKVGRVRIRHGAKTHLKAYTGSKGFVYIPPEGSKELVRSETVIYDNIAAPVKKGDKVGEYRIYVGDEMTGVVDVVVQEDVATGWFPSYIYISNVTSIVLLVVLIIFFLLILRIRAVKRRRKRLKAKRRREKIRELALKQQEIEEDRRRRNWTYM